jgi:hypothetical protein
MDTHCLRNERKIRYDALRTFELSTHWRRHILTLTSPVCRVNVKKLSTIASASSWPNVLVIGTNYNKKGNVRIT